MKKANRIVSKPRPTARNTGTNINTTSFRLLHKYLETFACTRSDIVLFGSRRFQISSIITAAILFTPDDIELKWI